jgi:hypothetical protein
MWSTQSLPSRPRASEATAGRSLCRQLARGDATGGRPARCTPQAACEALARVLEDFLADEGVEDAHLNEVRRTIALLGSRPTVRADAELEAPVYGNEWSAPCAAVARLRQAIFYDRTRGESRHA